MKTQINLYQPSCYPKRDKFTFRQFSILLGACLVGVFLLVFLLNKQLTNTQQKEQQHRAVLQDKQAELSELVAQLKKNRVPDAKIREQQNIEEEITAKRSLLASLSGVELGITVSFSELMRGLSLADLNTISINQFSIEEGQLNISGEAKYSDSVALWLEKAQTTKELSGLSFEKLTITDSEDSDNFSFNLSNIVKNKSVKAIAQ